MQKDDVALSKIIFNEKDKSSDRWNLTRLTNSMRGLCKNGVNLFGINKSSTIMFPGCL